MPELPDVEIYRREAEKSKNSEIEYFEVDDYTDKNEIGPDVLELNESEFVSKLGQKNSMVKTALTDQSLLSGIGNVYADEILFQAKIHPKHRASKLGEKDWKNVYKKTQQVLKKAIEKDADVSKFPKTYLLPNRKEGNACPNCKGKIQTIKISGRTSYFCPSCQEK